MLQVEVRIGFNIQFILNANDNPRTKKLSHLSNRLLKEGKKYICGKIRREIFPFNFFINI